METLEVERKKLRRAKEIIATTQSPYLKRDLQKYVRRTERKLKKMDYKTTFPCQTP